VGLCHETVIAQLRLTNSECYANESLRARRRDWTAAANLPAGQEETTASGKDVTQPIMPNEPWQSCKHPYFLLR
jgi:hypothetical protein